MAWGCTDFTLFLHLVEFGMTAAALEPQSYRVGLVLIHLVEVISCLSGLVQHSCEIGEDCSGQRQVTSRVNCILKDKHTDNCFASSC